MNCRLMEARSRLGMRPEDPGPLRGTGAVRADLRARLGSTVDDGMQHLERALQIHPEYDDAMAYLNLLYRERADLLDSASEYQRDVQIADEWVRRALETKRAKAAAGAGGRCDVQYPRAASTSTSARFRGSAGGRAEADPGRWKRNGGEAGR